MQTLTNLLGWIIPLLLLFLGGCSYTGDNNLHAAVGIGENHVIEFKVKGTVDTTITADPWSGAEWIADSVEGLIALPFPGSNDN